MKSIFTLVGLLFMAFAVQAVPAPERAAALVEHTDIANIELDTTDIESTPDTSPNVIEPFYHIPSGNEQWDCRHKTGGLGHNALKQIHTDFNRLFGNPRLTAAARQRYVAVCRGVVFAFINNYDSTATEYSGTRNDARNRSPGNGRECEFVFIYTKMGYFFGRESEYPFSSRDSVRRC